MLIVYDGDAGPELRRWFAEAANRLGVRIEVVEPGVESGADPVDAWLGEVDIWWHVLTPITAWQISAAPNLRLIHKWGVGLNTIDLDAAAAHGVAVANMPGSNAAAVAEHATLLTLAVLRQLPVYHEATAAGRGWSVESEVGERSRELAGKTVGLVGYGDIAQRFERILGGFGARVVHHSRRTDRPGWMPLDELVALADVVSLHVPLTEETARLFDADRIGLMKRGAVLVNTARGGLVDLDALDAALEAGALAGAGLDTFDEEPWNARLVLGRHPGVVVTPHVAWLTRETLDRSLELALAEVEALLPARAQVGGASAVRSEGVTGGEGEAGGTEGVGNSTQ